MLNDSAGEQLWAQHETGLDGEGSILAGRMGEGSARLMGEVFTSISSEQREQGAEGNQEMALRELHSG